MRSRFDYVQYDETAQRDQAIAKESVQMVERTIEMICPGSSQSKYKALQHLEECYMWIGKLIRDDLLKKNDAAPLQEERTNS